MLTLKTYRIIIALTEVDDSYMIHPIRGHFLNTKLITEAYRICQSIQSS